MRSFDDLTNELLVIDEQIRLLEQRKAELKKEFFSQIETFGSKDSRGNFYYRLGNKIIKKEARKSMKINNEKAKEILSSLGVWEEVSIKKFEPNKDKLEDALRLGIITEEQYNAICDIKEEVDENLLEQLVLNDRLSLDDVSKIVDEKVSYALVIKEDKGE